MTMQTQNAPATIKSVTELEKQENGEWWLIDHKTAGSFKVAKAIGLVKMEEALLNPDGTPQKHKNGKPKKKVWQWQNFLPVNQGTLIMTLFLRWFILNQRLQASELQKNKPKSMVMLIKLVNFRFWQIVVLNRQEIQLVLSK